MADLEPLTAHIALLNLANATRSNIYVVREDGGDTLVDPGPVGTAPAILALDRAGALRLRRVILTHAHPAHAGSAARVIRGTGVAAWVHELDAPYVDGREQPLLPRGRRGQLIAALGRVVDLCPPLYRTERLVDGVRIGDLLPVATPGHTPGHVALYHERDRALLCGDAVLHDGARLHLPEPSLSEEPERARTSLRALAELDCEALLCGHGPPLLRGAKERLAEAIAELC
jgi:glyoxylase-like metal-dependent hydrolase (beta-lactamase superfamily II)